MEPSASMQQALLPPSSKDQTVDAKRAYLTTFEDPIAEAYIAGQTLDEPFYSVAAPGTVWPTDGSMPLDLNLMIPPPSLDPNDPSSGFATDQNGQFDSLFSANNGHNGGSDPFDSAAAILDDAGFARITEIKSEPDFDGTGAKGTDGDQDAAEPSYAHDGNRSGSISAGSTSGAASKDGIPPRRRTRRRQNISCDQCRASKRGCDFQLRLDADGNDVSQGNDDEQMSTGNTGDKRKMSDAGQESISGSGSNKLVCSNCQRRGIECTTNFADSVRESKQSAQSKDEPIPQGSKKRAIADDTSENGMRSKSISSDGSSPGPHNQEAREQLLKTFQNRDESQMLSTTGQNVRFAQRADSLLLTTNRMRLYVHTVEPNANLWLSRACSPLRTDGDLGAYIKSAIGLDALDLSQKLWASWHVDAPSARKEHQPNLFYLVYGLDHLGGEMGVWGEKPQQFTQASASQPRGAGTAQEASAQFSDIISDIMGMGPGGWRRSKRDLMIDEAVKAAMLAYACQFRLDDEMTSTSADAASRKAVDGKNYRDAHDRIATAAWKRARSLILQLAPRRSCRIAYGLFLFGVTAPPPGALTEGGARSGADAAEDAAFALETASRHLEWFVKRCRDLVRTVDKASTNPLLSANPQVKQQRRIATDLMGLAESLGWFGLLIDTVTHVSQGRRSSMREDNLVYQSSGIGSGTDPGVKHGPVPSPGSDGSAPDRTAEALFAMQDTLNLLPSRQAPPGAFPGTSESYMHEDPEDDGTFPVDTEMSRRIMERAACARDLIPALLRNPGALANAIPFDVLIGANDPDAPTGPAGGSIININNPGGGLNEQVVLLGVAWGTAVEVYIWRRVGVLHTASEALLSTTDPVQALIAAGGAAMVSEKIEKMVMNVIEAIRLFHNIFDHLIARALDEFVHLSRQGRTMLSFFVIHIHLGVLHFVQLAKRIEAKELELIQAFNAGGGSGKSSPSSGVSPMTTSSPSGTSPKGATGGGSPPKPTRPQLRSNMLLSAMERRMIGKSAALGMARMASLINAESSKLESAARVGRLTPTPSDGKRRKGSFYASPVEDFTPIEDSANAPWRHPYPAMVADVLKLSSQQLHDEIWDQLIAVPRDEVELKVLMDNFNVLLEGFGRMLHAVPGLGSYKKTLGDLENARDTAAFVASQNG
uniref:Zn(2)-C6 fungal-type domain-containing protein n=1 Tax=Kalmanozyma brasiliensis (strain GHG001) TaxID=1365824 RepID=V5EX52_KALBG